MSHVNPTRGKDSLRFARSVLVLFRLWSLLYQKIINHLGFGCSILGASCEVETPVPIPNTAVKHFSADGSTF